jgi:hypothetical protein
MIDEIVIGLTLLKLSKYIPYFSRIENYYKLIEFIKKIKYKNTYMLDKLKQGVYQLYIRQRLYFEKREEQKELKRKAKIQRLKREVKHYEDAIKEKQMFKDGFCKCAHCKHYSSPELLHDNLKNKPINEESELSDIPFNCKKCGSLFVSDMLSKYADKEGLPQTVTWLKEKREKMVYLNMPVILHENKCA